jgi:hypothetical protein
MEKTRAKLQGRTLSFIPHPPEHLNCPTYIYVLPTLSVVMAETDLSGTSDEEQLTPAQKAQQTRTRRQAKENLNAEKLAAETGE